MIIDLNINTPHFWKFVDDTTASEVVPKGNTNNALSIVNHVIECSHINRVLLKPWWMHGAPNLVCSESSWTGYDCYRQKEVEVASAAKLLGPTISANLTWNAHIEEVVKKASKRFYFLVQPKRTKLSPTGLILFYNTCVRSVVDYAVQVFIAPCHNNSSTSLFVLRKGRSQSLCPARATTMHVKSLE